MNSFRSGGAVKVDMQTRRACRTTHLGPLCEGLDLSRWLGRFSSEGLQKRKAKGSLLPSTFLPTSSFPSTKFFSPTTFTTKSFLQYLGRWSRQIFSAKTYNPLASGLLFSVILFFNNFIHTEIPIANMSVSWVSADCQRGWRHEQQRNLHTREPSPEVFARFSTYYRTPVMAGQQQVVEENENEGEEKDCDYRRPESSTDEEEEDYVYRRQQWLVGAGSPSIGEDDWTGYAEDGEAESSQPPGLRDSENDTSSHFEIDPHDLLRELEGRDYRVADEYSGYDGVDENVLRRAAVQDDCYDGDCEDNESWWYDDMNDNEVLDDNAYRHDDFLECWGAVDWHQEPRQREDAPISPRTRAGTPGSPGSVVNDWNHLSDSSDSSVEFLFECQAWDSSTNSSGSSIDTQLSSFSDTSKRERSESLEALQDSVQVNSLCRAVIHRESNKRKREDSVEFERNVRRKHSNSI